MDISRRLEGKVAIITGGASGIGEAAARLFVENGAFVLIADIQDDLGLRLAQDLGPHTATFKHCDVTVEADVEAAVAMAVTKWGRLDVMFSNAGTIGRGGEGMSVKDLDLAAFDRVLGVNLRGAAIAVKHAAKAMLEGANQKGSIICTSSVCGVAGGIGPIDYTVSKHGLIGLVRAAASDLGKHGIRVNCVSPAGIATPLGVTYIRQRLNDADISPAHVQSLCDNAAFLAHHSLAPIDIAYAALYLASDESSFVTGLNLVVDGGATATQNPPQPSASESHE